MENRTLSRSTSTAQHNKMERREWIYYGVSVGIVLIFMVVFYLARERTPAGQSDVDSLFIRDALQWEIQPRSVIFEPIDVVLFTQDVNVVPMPLVTPDPPVVEEPPEFQYPRN